jgi:glycosyltransferase involved in cell wall biosynthesis
MKLASFVHPHVGGTFAVHRQLRSGLRAYGIDVDWLCSSREAGGRSNDPAFSDEARSGAYVGRATDSEHEAVKALYEAVSEGHYDGVILHVLAERAPAILMQYLPASVLRIMVVHNITPGTYAAAAAMRPFVHATVGVSPRIREDLIRRYGFNSAHTVAVSNAAEIAQVSHRSRREEEFKLLFLGRVEDASKGIFWLPDLMRRLPDNVTLTVAGDGPDLKELRASTSEFGSRTRFLGAVTRDRLPALLAEQDALIAPSRYEGFGVVLAEAMACGCVPLASHIKGVTDFVIDDGRSGFLFPVGDMATAAAQIRELMANPERLAEMSIAAQAVVRERYSVERLGRAYHSLLMHLAAQPPAVASPLRLEDWKVPLGLRAGLRTFLPQPVKNALLVLRERFA